MRAIKLIVLLVLVGLVVGYNTITAAVPAWENAAPPAAVGPYGYGAVAVDPTHPGTVYLATDTDGLWKSTNYGTSWIKARAFDGGAWPAVDAFNGTVYSMNFYGQDQGVHRSLDGGVTWQQTFPAGAQSYDVYSIKTDPFLANHVIATFHSGWTSYGGWNGDAGVAESFDAGTNWIWHAPQPGVGYGHYVFFLSNSSIWLLATQDHGIWRTTNNGTTWAQVSTNSMTHGAAQLVPFKGALYLTAVSGLLRSTNDGVSWTLGTGAGNSYFNGLGTDGTSLYTRPAFPLAGGWYSAPMRVSTDGLAWSDYNSQVYNNGPNQMASDGQYIYASMWTGGFWRLPIGGTLATTTPTATSTNTPTFTPTSTPVPPTPTFTTTPVAATPTPVSICLRSTDNGNTFTKVAC